MWEVCDHRSSDWPDHGFPWHYSAVKFRQNIHDWLQFWVHFWKLHEKFQIFSALTCSSCIFRYLGDFKKNAKNSEGGFWNSKNRVWYRFIYFKTQGIKWRCQISKNRIIKRVKADLNFYIGEKPRIWGILRDSSSHQGVRKMRYKARKICDFTQT